MYLCEHKCDCFPNLICKLASDLFHFFLDKYQNLKLSFARICIQSLCFFFFFFFFLCGFHNTVRYLGPTALCHAPGKHQLKKYVALYSAVNGPLTFVGIILDKVMVYHCIISHIT